MPRPKNTTERRAQIVQGLIEVMAARGYDRASIASIAEAAGLTTGLIHYHFKNKGEILLAALEHLVTRHRAVLDAELKAAGSDPRARLGAFIDVHVGLGRTTDPTAVACWILMSGEALREPRVQVLFDQAIVDLRARLAEIIEQGVRSDTFRRVDGLAASTAIVASIQGYFVLSGTAPSVIPRGTAAICIKQMADGLLAFPAVPEDAP
ncbi:MAG: TetR/AcrR family transcriptional regulator [Myxococcota bacterium]